MDDRTALRKLIAWTVLSLLAVIAAGIVWALERLNGDGSLGAFAIVGTSLLAGGTTYPWWHAFAVRCWSRGTLHEEPTGAACVLMGVAFASLAFGIVGSSTLRAHDAAYAIPGIAWVALFVWDLVGETRYRAVAHVERTECERLKRITREHTARSN